MVAWFYTTAGSCKPECSAKRRKFQNLNKSVLYFSGYISLMNLLWQTKGKSFWLLCISCLKLCWYRYLKWTIFKNMMHRLLTDRSLSLGISSLQVGLPAGLNHLSLALAALATESASFWLTCSLLIARSKTLFKCRQIPAMAAEQYLCKI